MSARLPRPELVGRLVAGEQSRAAYELGRWCEAEDELDRAVGWYRLAAEAGSQQAALRLGDVLGRLAEQRDGQGPGGGALDAASEDSPELLIAEASRWLSGVVDRPDAVGLITDMLNRQQRLAARRALDPEAVG